MQSDVYHRDRRGWRRVTDEVAEGFGYVWDLLPLAADDVWVGFNGLAHYDGRHWTRADLPGDDSRIQIINLTATGPHDVWAAGLREDPALWRRPLILHYRRTHEIAECPAVTSRFDTWAPWDSNPQPAD